MPVENLRRDDRLNRPLGLVPTHVALLRGINVGGRNRVGMAALREVVAGLGHGDVQTYIQSGNVAFTSPETDVGTLASTIESAIADALGVRPRVIVLSRDEFAQVFAANPYPDEQDPKCVHAVFLREAPPPEAIAAVGAAQGQVAERGSRDEVRLVGCTWYLRTPEGIGRSELAAQVARIGDKYSASGTARNWATVARLLSILDG